MSLSEKITPTMRIAILVGAVLLAGLLALRFMSASPNGEYAPQRGVGAPQ